MVAGKTGFGRGWSGGTFHCQHHLLMDLLANIRLCLPAACTPFLPLPFCLAAGHWDAMGRC